MNNVWAYWPDTCDGEPCPKDCDMCPLREEAIEHREWCEGNPWPPMED